MGRIRILWVPASWYFASTATIRLCSKSLRQTVRTGEVEIVYDSTLDEQSPLAVQSGLSVLGPILVRPFTFDVDSVGKVVKVQDDVAEFCESVLEGMGSSPATAVTRPMFEQILSDNTMRQSIEAACQMLPQNAVTLGVTYTCDITAPNPVGKTTIHATVTPAREGSRDRVSLGFEGSLDATIGNANPALAQIDMKFTGGTISGRAVFDLSCGQMDRSSSTNTIHMEIRTKTADPMSELILRQVVKTTMTMETLSVEKKNEQPGRRKATRQTPRRWVAGAGVGCGERSLPETLRGSRRSRLLQADAHHLCRSRISDTRYGHQGSRNPCPESFRRSGYDRAKTN